jgi:5-formyltetrahydrofolate cyclo-ligase
MIEQERWEVASLLDGMEKVGRHITLSQLQASGLKIPLMVTGAGAINMQGLRFGKGHGFFDLEFATLKDIGVVGDETKVVGVVHECQVLDKELVVEEWDVGCDFVVSDKRVIEVENAAKPGCGIVWEKLREGMLEDIEPLGELNRIQEGKRGRNG